MFKDKKYWIEIFVLLLFYAGHLLGISVLRYAGLGILAAMLLWFDPGELICAYAFLIPNTYLVKITSNGSALAGYVMLITVVKLLLMRKNRRVAFDVAMSLYLHLGIVAISVVWNGDTSFVSAVVRFCAQIILAMLLLNENVLSKEKLVSRYIAGNCFSIVLALIYNLFWGISNMNGHFASIGNDRNYFAITLVCALSIHLIYMVIESRNMKAKILQALLLVAGILLSGSRTASILLIFPASIYVWSIRKLSVRRKVCMIILLLVMILFVVYFLGDAVDNILRRFSSDNVSGGNDRFESWEVHLKKVTENMSSFLLGCGSSIVNSVYYQVEHNTLVQGLYTIGSLGLSTLLGVYATIIKHGLRGRKLNFSVITLGSIVVGYCTVNGLYSDNLTFAITLSLVVYQLASESEVQRTALVK